MIEIWLDFLTTIEVDFCECLHCLCVVFVDGDHWIGVFVLIWGTICSEIPQISIDEDQLHGKLPTLIILRVRSSIKDIVVMDSDMIDRDCI